MRKLLFVEGAGDKDFFTKLFEKIPELLKSEFNIQILVPTDVGIKKDGKEYVKQAIIDNIKENSLDNNSLLGCILDADYGDSQNIIHILTELCKKTKDYSYDTFEQHKETGGYYLKSNDGLKDVGIWFMPNNKDEGMFEDWLLNIAKNDENYLINYAKEVCNKIPECQKRFDDIHKTKAQVAVWTALQKAPHLGTENIILQNLYNHESPYFQNFIIWLKFVFDIKINQIPMPV